jgi:peptidoglycan/LPS O-acetylase OafA/YrhL
MRVTNRFEVLDGVRGVAALCVMVHHFSRMSGYPFIKNGWIAVDLFFVLSGFVLNHAYGSKLAASMTYRDYVARRVIRLFPMMILGAALGLPVMVAYAGDGLSGYSFGQIIAAAIYNSVGLPFISSASSIDSIVDKSVAVGEIFPLNPPEWSLFFEVIASLLLPFLLRLRTASLLQIAFAAFCGCVVIGAIDQLVGEHYAVSFNLGWGSANFIGGFPRVLFGFAVGTTLYRVVRLEKLEKVSGALAAILAIVSKHSLLVYGLAALLLAQPFGIRGLYPGLFLLLGAPLIVLVGANCDASGRIEGSFCRLLGWLSYPLYCLHLPILRATSLYLKNDPKLLFAVATVVTLLLSAVAAAIYDAPLRGFLTNRSKNASRERVRLLEISHDEAQCRQSGRKRGSEATALRS